MFSMKRLTCILLVGIASCAQTAAFSIDRPQSATTRHQNGADSPVSRRNWMALVGVTGASALIFPSPASADVTNKVASSTALRNVKRAAKQLDKAELYAANGNYEEMKAELRISPLADIRKNCFVLVRGGEDGPQAEVLTSSYQTFIQRMETMDNAAGLAMRGRKMPEGQLYDNYKTTVAALAEFLHVAEESTSVPVQYDNESG